MSRKTSGSLVRQFLENDRVRKTEVGGRTCFAAVDLVAVLTESQDPAAEWDEIKEVEPALRAKTAHAVLPGSAGPQDILSLAGVMRLILAVDSPLAERLRNRFAELVAESIEAEADPELAIQRMRQAYEMKGHSRRWIDERLRSISARHELVHAWHERGVRDGEQFSALTNELMRVTFGKDVNAYRQLKGVGANLRDHLNDLELALLSLAEATTASLHRHRDSHDMDALLADIRDAGQIVSNVREQIAEATATASELTASR